MNYAAQIIETRRDAERARLEPSLKAKMIEKLGPATACVDKFSALFATSTSESPENIFKAAFARCADLFRAAAEARVSPEYRGERRSELVEAAISGMKKASVDRTIQIVVEERARQKLAPPNSESPAPIERRDSKI